MEDIKNIVAENLTELRKLNKYTQSELAQKLNYSDKSVSKWERGESLPDIEVLYSLAELYGVTLDELVKKHTEKQSFVTKNLRQKNNKLIITLLAISAVWIAATIIYVSCSIIIDKFFWMLFVWPLPFSALIALIFNSVWGNRIYTFYISSAMIWSLLACFYLQFLKYNIWAIFILGIPMQTAIILWSRLKS